MKYYPSKTPSNAKISWPEVRFGSFYIFFICSLSRLVFVFVSSFKWWQCFRWDIFKVQLWCEVVKNNFGGRTDWLHMVAVYATHVMRRLTADSFKQNDKSRWRLKSRSSSPKMQDDIIDVFDTGDGEEQIYKKLPSMWKRDVDEDEVLKIKQARKFYLLFSGKRKHIINR